MTKIGDILASANADFLFGAGEDQLRLLIDGLPVLVWMSGPDKGMVWANRAWLDHTGRTLEQELGEGWLESVHPDDMPRLAACMEAFEAKRPFRTDFRLRRHDGAWRWMEDSGAPRFDAEGRFLGFVGSCLDVTERREAEAAVRESEERFRLIADSAPVPIWVTQLDRKRGFVNRAYVEFLGISYEEAVDFDWRTIIHPEDAPRILAESVAGEATLKPFVLEARYRRHDGAWRWLRSTSQPRWGPNGEHNGFIGVAHDITEAKEAEAALRKSEEHLRLLVGELNHRVKNTLAIVQAVALQTFRNDGIPGEARRAFEGRLAALAAAHSLLTRENWEAADLRDVVGEALHAHEAGHRFTIEGPPVPLEPRSAVSVAMALHELATNASKYGALSSSDGHVTVSWEVTGGDDPRLALRWEESGGPPVKPPERRGFGSRMIERALASELRGTVRLDFRPEGVVCTIDAGLPASTGAAFPSEG